MYADCMIIEVLLIGVGICIAIAAHRYNELEQGKMLRKLEKLLDEHNEKKREMIEKLLDEHNENKREMIEEVFKKYAFKKKDE